MVEYTKKLGRLSSLERRPYISYTGQVSGLKKIETILDYHCLSYVERKEPRNHYPIRQSNLALKMTSATKEATYRLLTQSFLTLVSFIIAWRARFTKVIYLSLQSKSTITICGSKGKCPVTNYRTWIRTQILWAEKYTIISDILRFWSMHKQYMYQALSPPLKEPGDEANIEVLIFKQEFYPFMY